VNVVSQKYGEFSTRIGGTSITNTNHPTTYLNFVRLRLTASKFTINEGVSISFIVSTSGPTGVGEGTGLYGIAEVAIEYVFIPRVTRNIENATNVLLYSIPTINLGLF
jgi:hypothetical protein